MRSAEKIEFLKKHFIVRNDTFVVETPSCFTQSKNRLVRVRSDITDNILKMHIEGKETIHTYTLNKDNKVKFFAYDFDNKNASICSYQLLQYIIDETEYSKSCSLVSTGGRGYHLYVHSSSQISAKYAIYCAKQLYRESGAHECEIFPKQERLSSIARFGNSIRLPLGMNRKYGKYSHIIYPTNLHAIEPFEFKEDDKILYETLEDRIENNSPNMYYLCYRKMFTGVNEGCRDEVAFALARHYVQLGLNKDEITTLLNTWNEKNSPPLELAAINSKVQSATKGYSIGCKSIKNNPMLLKFCTKECSFYKE